VFFYVDESGQTGLNLFDEAQPFLYYGVLASKTNVDVLASSAVRTLRKRLGVERLHAAELGNGRLVEIVNDINALTKKYCLTFDFCRVVKVDHALISFFDQVFDAGLNPAVPWTAYWTPLRYVLLIKLAYLFDQELLERAWKARISVNDVCAEQIVKEVCEVILERADRLPDNRSREIITDSLKWVITNTARIGYNADTKEDMLHISPNLIGFQSVLHMIAARLESAKRQASRVIVDQQSQFNAAQGFVAKSYYEGRALPWVNGHGLPVMSLKHMPSVPISCTARPASIGLELVDIFIWIFKRFIENKELAPDLLSLVKSQLNKGRYDEVSMDALDKRWGKWFEDLPEPTGEQIKTARKLIAEQEKRRKAHVLL
jgi:hypothetical protein